MELQMGRPMGLSSLARQWASISRGGDGAVLLLVLSAGSSRRASAQVVRAGKQMMMWESLREAVDEEMERDPTVCIMGEQAPRPLGHPAPL
jgi:hypothetical protein